MRARLGTGILMPQQIAIAESVRDHDKTAVASGQKTGKSFDAVGIALWFYESFPRARVIMTANTKTQIRDVLWRELRHHIRNAPVRIAGKWSDNPATGFQSDDGREIRGGTAREIESLAGVSGGAQLFIVDEASALVEQKAQAIEGNRAGAGVQRVLYLSNPTRAEGPFFEAFHARKNFWRGFEVNSENVAAWHAGHRAEIAAWQERAGLEVTGELPGVVTQRRIEQWREEYGVDSPFYRVRVKGEFLLNEGGKAITLHMIAAAQAAWHDGGDEEGELSIGVDPAGPGLGGDETAFAPVRGRRQLALFSSHGLTEDAIIEQLMGMLSTFRRRDEGPRVVIDSEGPIGSALFYRLRAIAEGIKDPQKRFDVHGIRASLPASREPLVYDRIRDELVANLARWLRDGGAIVSDHKLEQELHAAEWISQVSGKLKLTAKDEIRDKLGRSPDRRDALALAVWQPFVWVSDEQRVDGGTPGPTGSARRADSYEEAFGGGYREGDAMDLYGSTDWSRR